MPRHRVSSESDKYRLSVKEYRPDSTAGDGFRHHDSHAFSTYDIDNDVYPGKYLCHAFENVPFNLFLFFFIFGFV